MITGSVLLSSKIIKFSKNHRWLLPYFLAMFKNNHGAEESKIFLVSKLPHYCSEMLEET